MLPIADGDAGPGVPDYPAIRAMAVGAEAAGLDSVWVFDHLLFRFDGERAASTSAGRSWPPLPRPPDEWSSARS